MNIPDVDLIQVVLDAPLVARVTAYPHEGVARSSTGVQEFFSAAEQRLVPEMALGLWRDEVPEGVTVPLLSINFTRSHLPLPMETVMEWLRAHPLIRLIEVEWYSPAEPST